MLWCASFTDQWHHAGDGPGVPANTHYTHYMLAHHTSISSKNSASHYFTVLYVRTHLGTCDCDCAMMRPHNVVIGAYCAMMRPHNVTMWLKRANIVKKAGRGNHVISHSSTAGACVNTYPVRVVMHVPVATCHSLIVLSQLPETR